MSVQLKSKFKSTRVTWVKRLGSSLRWDNFKRYVDAKCLYHRFNMNRLMNQPCLKGGSGIVIAIGVACFGSPTFARPLSDPSGLTLNTSVVNLINDVNNKGVPYVPPPDHGTPQPTGGTGSRGGCMYIPDRPPLAGLVGQSHLMLTTSDRPVFWIYVPYSPDIAPSGVLSLQQGGDAIYEGEFSLASTPGVVGIQLPETAPELAVDQDYDWFIDIHCVAAIEDTLTPDSNPGSLDGLVRRVAISDDLASDLAMAQTELDRIAAYGRHYIWYDWITEFARLRLGPDDSAELDMLWRDVLSDEEAVLLTPWAAEPLVEEITTTVLQSSFW